MSAKITITIKVKETHAEYTEYAERNFGGDEAEGPARDAYHALLDLLNGTEPGEEEQPQPPEHFGPGYPKSESNPGGYE